MFWKESSNVFVALEEMPKQSLVDSLENTGGAGKILNLGKPGPYLRKQKPKNLSL